MVVAATTLCWAGWLPSSADPGATPATPAPSTSPTSPASPSTTPTEAGATPGKLLLLLDSSGSMAEPAGGGSTKIAAAKNALDQVIDSLPDDAPVGLRVFGAKNLDKGDKGACTDSQRVVGVGTGNRDALRTAVDRYTPRGETPISYALRQAAKDLGPKGQRSIVLVSDGIATCKPDPCKIAKELTESGIDLHINVVGLSVNSAARAQLRCIAAAGKGTYYDAGSADDIVKSITTVSERALRPFTIDGTPIKGGASQAKAVPVQTGRYADRVAAKGERWYRYERAYPSSQVLASSYVMAPGLLSGVSIDLYGTDGAQCTGTPYSFWAKVFTGSNDIAGLEGQRDSCYGPTVLLRVSSSADKSREFGLTVWEEPIPSNEADLPAAINLKQQATFRKPKAGSTATPITPGSTFADATPLTSGRTYRSTIVPGEVQAYRIHVGYGQRLSVAVDLPKARNLDQVALPRSYDLQVLSPLRNGVDDLQVKDWGSSDQRADKAVRQYAGTVAVRWLNRTGDSVSFTAGDYYIAYQADFGGDSIELPYRITARVDGKESGIPTYPSGQTLRTVEQDTSDTPSPSPSATGSATSATSSSPGATAPPSNSADGGSGSRSAGWIAAGVAVVAVVGAGGFLLGRRRRP